MPARRRARRPRSPATSRSPPTRSTARSGPTTPPFTETTPLAPNSPYAASKAGADLLVRAAHHTHGMDTVITRCSNNYGPYQFPEKLIPLFVTNALADIPLPVYGDGMQVRDWIHVRDHCRGVDAALRRGPGRRGLQLRRPERAVQHRRDPGRARADRQARDPDPPRHRPPRPRPPLRRRLRQGRGRAGLAPDRHLRAGPGRDRRLVPGQRPTGSTASARGPIARPTATTLVRVSADTTSLPMRAAGDRGLGVRGRPSVRAPDRPRATSSSGSRRRAAGPPSLAHLDRSVRIERCDLADDRRGRPRRPGCAASSPR